MGGKAAILLVLGFSTIFLVVGNNFNNLANNAVNNYDDYYIESTAHNIATSGANMAASLLFFDKTWEAGFEDLEFAGGELTVIVSNNPYGASAASKTTICHVPPGNPSNSHTIRVANSAVAAHLAHGDYLGECGSDVVDNDMVTIVAEGTFAGKTEVVTIEFRPSNFSKFGNFYSTISAYPATGDTFNGPFHTNGKLTTYGKPVFNGKVTTKNGLQKLGSPKDPKFYGGYESGVDIPLEFDTTGYAGKADVKFYDTTGTNKITNVKLTFNNDGTVTWQQQIHTGPWSSEVTVPLATIAPNGMIYVEKGNIYAKGTLDGKVTIVATKAGKTGAGNIYQTGDLKYKDDPLTDPNSTDLLGMVAEDNIRVQYNDDTKHKDIVTQASMFALNGNIGPDDNLVDNDGYLKSWKILGGLIAKTTRVTADYSGSNPVNGYKFVHSFDERFFTQVPPHFPHTKNFEVVAWHE